MVKWLDGPSYNSAMATSVALAMVFPAAKSGFRSDESFYDVPLAGSGHGWQWQG